MERISHLIEKIRTTYYDNREKTLIDLDLLLDYTRVMYADLLEWRAGLDAASATSGSDSTSTGPADTVAAAPEGTNRHSKVQAADQPEQEIMERGNRETPSDRPDPESTEKQAPAAGMIPEAAPAGHEQPEKEDEEAESTEKGNEEEPNKMVERMKSDHSSISFEPPSAPPVSGKVQEDDNPPEQPAEDIPVSPDAAKEETASAGNTKAAETGKDQEHQSTDKPAENMSAARSKIPESPVKDTLPDFKKIFEKANAAGSEERSDIRKLIGINDKYLFLNELFNNHKSEYEETLDHLNKMDSAASARQFLEKEIAPKYKWLTEDATVESFYWVVERHLKR